MRKIKNYYKSNLRCQIINYNKRILYLRFDFLYLLCIQLDLDAKRKGIIRLLYVWGLENGKKKEDFDL